MGHLEPGQNDELQKGMFQLFTTSPDVQALIRTLRGLQTNAQATSHIIYDYENVSNGVAKKISNPVDKTAA